MPFKEPFQPATQEKPSLKKETGERLDFPNEMYAVSGFDEPNFAHYERSKRFDKAIEEEVSYLEIALSRADQESLYAIIANRHGSGRIQLKALQEAAHSSPPETFRWFAKQALLKGSAEEKSFILSVMDRFSPEERTEIMLYFTETPNDPPFVKDAFINARLLDVKEKEQSSFIQTLLNSPAAATRLAAINYLRLVPKDKQLKLIYSLLSTENEKIRAEAFKKIDLLPTTEEGSRLRRIFTPFFKLISQLPDTTREDFLLRTFQTSNSEEVQKAALQNLRYRAGYLSPKSKNVYKAALKSKFPFIRKSALRYALLNHPGAFTEDKLLASLQKDPTIEVRAAAVDLTYIQLWHKGPEYQEELVALIRKNLQSKEIELQQGAVKSIFRINDLKIRKELLAENPDISPFFVQSPLYNKHETFSSERFERADFEKDGSKTTLLGGSLKNLLIIRHINAESFLGWKKAYENHSAWQKAGFDYVPMEPIQSYQFDASIGQVRVASGVLDMSFGQWKRLAMDTPEHLHELEEKQATILETLSLLGVIHGHTHNENFVLRFFRNPDGSVDFDRCPRIYIIDFDQSKSSRDKTPHSNS
jgi:HEAT repeat protein